MPTPGRSYFLSRVGIVRHTILFAVIVMAALCLQSCGGSGNSAVNFSSTTNNPAPGISLQSIQITPSTSLIALAEKRQLIATGVYTDGSTADLSSQVTWASTSGASLTNFVSITPAGMATGVAIGATVVIASLGNVTGTLQLTVDTNGFTSGALAVLSVPYKSSIIDAAYLPLSLTKIQGAYAVQEVNLDAEQFSSVLPVEVALLASVPMPTGFVPNAAVAIQSTFQVAVISYSSPDVQIIDASNLSSDLASNTVVNTFTSPVTQSVTIDGVKCMICAAVIDPSNNDLLLSTAQGYYSMNLTTGVFTALPFSPAPVPARNFSLNPTGTNPYIVAPDPATGDLQILNMKTNAVTSVGSGSTGVTTPGSVVVDLLSGYAAVVDAQTNNQSIGDLASLQSPVFTPVADVGVCGSPAIMDMAATGISANPSASQISHTLITSQTSGNCVGFQSPWPQNSSSPLVVSDINYAYGNLPPTPDGQPFVNGTDSNTITAFNDVYKTANYAVLVDANQQWIARINYASLLGTVSGTSILPAGSAILPLYLCSGGVACVVPPPFLYLPTPATAVITSVTSISFGTVGIGVPSPISSLTLSDIGQTQISPVVAIKGAAAGDYLLDNSCPLLLLEQTNCGIGVTFTPSAVGARNATLSITYSGGSPISIPLTGAGASQ
jgi:hypothetical protein